MSSASQLVVAFVAVIHIWILVLEMFLWTRPSGLRAFRNTPERANTTRVLAANQGLYNGFLAAGLITSFFYGDPAVARAFQLFFLACVAVAGVFGAVTVSVRILLIQTFPAVVGLALLTF